MFFFSQVSCISKSSTSDNLQVVEDTGSVVTNIDFNEEHYEIYSLILQTLKEKDEPIFVSAITTPGEVWQMSKITDVCRVLPNYQSKVINDEIVRSYCSLNQEIRF